MVNIWSRRALRCGPCDALFSSNCLREKVLEWKTTLHELKRKCSILCGIDYYIFLYVK
jgi:hypothetical protein